jgi:hypothetical protein
VLFLPVACTNPMVEYLLAEDTGVETPPLAPPVPPPPPSPLALLKSTGVWYYSLQDAVDAAGSGGSERIEIRKNITDALLMGGNEIVLAAGKDIELAPYVSDTAEVIISHRQTSGSLFTVEPGVSLVLHGGIVIQGNNSTASDPLVRVSGGTLTMKGGSAVTGGGVYVEHDDTSVPPINSTFTMKSGSTITGAGVYLETGAVITLKGPFTVNPLVLITPQKYPDPDAVTPEIIPVLQGDITTAARNNAHTDVTPERVPGWKGLRHWRVDESGNLVNVIARRFDSGLNEPVYYQDLQKAFDEGDPVDGRLDEITLLSNLKIDPAGKWPSFGSGGTFANRPYITVPAGRRKRLTVPANNSYTITRTGDINQRVFSVESNAVLELAAPLNTTITIDGGGYASGEALVYAGAGIANWDFPGNFRLGSGVILKNNRRTIGHGGAVEAEGTFVMTGGTITGNVTAGNGGALFLKGHADLYPHTISGGTISYNEAGGSGGAVMLDYLGNVQLTMTGGVITNNRAKGPAGNSSAVNGDTGYGGGIFIPTGVGDRIVVCRLLGGTIQNNESANGRGRGIAMDRTWPYVQGPKLYLGPAIRIINNDINLFVNEYFSYDWGKQDCLITLAGSWNVSYHKPSNPIPVTLVIDPLMVAPDLSGCRLLDEEVPGLVSGHHNKFTLPSPYYIGSDGKLYP